MGVRNVQSSSGNRIANLQTTATIAKELLRGGTSPTAEALMKSGAYHHHPSPTQSPPVHSDSKSGLEHRTKSRQQENNTSPVVRPKDQLMYLAQLLNFQVQFSDFPKGHSEFLSLVSLSTEPPQVCHGAGKTTDASHDQAALTALRALSELGLDSVTSSGSSLKKDIGGPAKSSINNSIGNSGDGVHIQPQSSGRQSQAPVIVASDGVAMGK
ncbi:hypothetical protein J437_LFUL007296 [Ladona fulva]|uniref:DRBM domain-containing protein n=1 Tax=Ladona fulva TaxID=123851 RepID=A0A8K0K2X4_LADFU|nr:hypothetical protein J437_LFUL007296 [Ladona fulva]